MAHNLSPAKAARLRQAERLTDWRRYLIYVRCCCGPAAHRMAALIAVDDLLARPTRLETFGRSPGGCSAAFTGAASTAWG